MTQYPCRHCAGVDGVRAAEATAGLETLEAYAGFQHNHPGPISRGHVTRRRAAGHGHRSGRCLPPLCQGVQGLASQTHPHQALQAPNQRQSRAVYSDPMPGMGLRLAVPELRNASSGCPAACRSMTGSGSTQPSALDHLGSGPTRCSADQRGERQLLASMRARDQATIGCASCDFRQSR